MNIYIGYDTNEDIAYQVCNYSITKNSNKSVSITPLIQSKLRDEGLYWRDIDLLGSTEFTFTRFLVPNLMNYRGWAIFCDCDFLWVDDIQKVFELADEQYAVMCVNHDYTPTTSVKMDGAKQYQYPRKNWSSMILWNCGHPKNKLLTPELINTVSGQYLHRFSWLDDTEIGSIDKQWNWLVNWYTEPQDGVPKAIHFTEGGPWVTNYRKVEYSSIWIQYNNDRLLS